MRKRLNNNYEVLSCFQTPLFVNCSEVPPMLLISDLTECFSWPWLLFVRIDLGLVYEIDLELVCGKVKNIRSFVVLRQFNFNLMKQILHVTETSKLFLNIWKLTSELEALGRERYPSWCTVTVEEDW